jgi:hypothetical protein
VKDYFVVERIPNWSQLRRTPISFLPSRSDTISFSVEARWSANFRYAQPWLFTSFLLQALVGARLWLMVQPSCIIPVPGVESLTVSHIKQLCSSCEHLRRQLLRNLARSEGLLCASGWPSWRGRVLEVEVLHLIC